MNIDIVPMTDDFVAEVVFELVSTPIADRRSTEPYQWIVARHPIDEAVIRRPFGGMDEIDPETASPVKEVKFAMAMALWLQSPKSVNYKSFADHPRSVTEIRSDRTMNASHWTPRDVLIDMLRMMDSHEAPEQIDTMVVFWREKKPDKDQGSGYAVTSRYSSAGPDLHSSVGTAQYGLFRLMNNALPD